MTIFDEMKKIILKQYKLGNTTYSSRQASKKDKALYNSIQDSVITSQASLNAHKRAVRTLVRVCEEMGIKELKDITPELASHMLFLRQAGMPIWNKPLSAWTVSADMLTLNHLLYGEGYWLEPLTKDKANQYNQEALKKGINLLEDLPGYSIDKENRQVFVDFYREEQGKSQGFHTPPGHIKYPIDLALQPRRVAERTKNDFTWDDWFNDHPISVKNNQEALLIGRAFGFRRHELIGREGYYNREIIPSTFGLDSNNRMIALIIGKGGEFRTAPVRLDLQKEVENIQLSNGLTLYQLAQQHPMNPIDQKEKKDLRNHLSKAFKEEAKVFDNLLGRPSGKLPYQALRRDYAQARLEEVLPHYPQEDIISLNGKEAPRGAFEEVSKDLGHNRVSVMASYFYTPKD